MDSYDALPYDSIPIPETHPERMAAMAALFGVSAASPDRCRVLELGCASGGNLIPLAFYHPESRFVGLERSAVQARAGQKLIEGLALRNITLIEGDILDFTWSGEPFDYLIAHGVFSWAPTPVREKILEIAAQVLAPDGLAYISYNTLPGWRLRGMLRDALRYAARGAISPEERMARARRQLDTLCETLSGMEAYAARHLSAEAMRLRALPDSYLFHEYLEEINQPLLFSDFAALAEHHGLKYLTDATPEWLLPEALPDKAAAMLRSIADPIEREQQLDFLIARAFRRSLLVRAGTAILPWPDFGHLASLSFFSMARAGKDLRLARPQRVEFLLPDGRRARVEHPLTKAAVAHLSAVYPDSVPFPELYDIARGAVLAAGGHGYALQSDHLLGELTGLFLHQIVEITPLARVFGSNAPAMPRAHALARAMAESGSRLLPTVRHGAFPIGGVERRVLMLMDGQHDPDTIAQSSGMSRTDADKIISALMYHGLTI